MKNLIIAMCVFLISCTDGETKKEENHDPLHYRKEIAALNIEFTKDQFFTYIEKGDKLVFDLFLKAGMSPNSEINMGNRKVITPLMLAINNKQYDMVLELLKSGSNPNKITQGQTPVSLSIELVDSKLLKILLDNGGDTDVEGSSDAVKLALKNMGPNMRRHGGGSFSDMYKIFEILAGHETNKSKPNEDLKTAFVGGFDRFNKLIEEKCLDKDKLASEKAKAKRKFESELFEFMISKCS